MNFDDVEGLVHFEVQWATSPQSITFLAVSRARKIGW